MTYSRWWFVVVVASATALACVSPRLTLAQSETDPGFCKVPASQAIGVSLQIAPADNHSEFREGELITLSADYSTGSAGNYFINTASPDSDEPLGNLEAVCVSPDSDGESRDVELLGGAYGASVDLLEHPQHFNVSLNAWHTLKPGFYRVYVESRRIRLGDDAELVKPATPVVISNPIEIRVVEASSPWQAQELAIAVNTLEAYEGSTRESEKLKAAATRSAAVLRFLNTEAAAREMARRYGMGVYDEEFREGLLTTKFRGAAIEEMNAAITDPNRPITDEFLTTLAELEVPPDPHAIDTLRGTATAETLDLLRERQERYLKRLAELKAATLAALPAKTAQSRSETLLDAIRDAHYPMDPTEKQQIVGVLLSSWDALVGINRVDLLGDKWELLGSTDWLPLLRTIVDRPVESEPTEQFQGGSWRTRSLTTGNARSMALYRIYELSPAEGRERILKEIAKPSGAIDMGTLGVLPDRELAQLDSVLMRNYEGGAQRALNAALVQRYGSAAIFPQLREEYQRNAEQIDCSTRSALLRYFLRVKPDFGSAQVKATLEAVTKGYDCEELLVSLGSEVRRPEIEKLAIEELYSSGGMRVQNAANALSEYGSAAAEAALWKRLDDYREERAHLDKPREVPDSDEDNGDATDDATETPPEQSPAAEEPRVLAALLDGNNWYLTADQIRSLETVVDPDERNYVESVAAAELDQPNRFFSFEWDRAKLYWTLGGSRGRDIESLRMKLAQLPPGTGLFVHAGAAEVAAHPAEYRELEDYANSDGLKINSYSTIQRWAIE